MPTAQTRERRKISSIIADEIYLEAQTCIKAKTEEEETEHSHRLDALYSLYGKIKNI